MMLGGLFRTLVITLMRLPERLRGDYRPERHYMRGPGPRARAKGRS